MKRGPMNAANVNANTSLATIRGMISTPKSSSETNDMHTLPAPARTQSQCLK